MTDFNSRHRRALPAAAPREIEQLVEGWRRQERPVQRGIAWPRVRWVTAFPEYRLCFEDLPSALDRGAVRATVGRALDQGDSLGAFLPVMAWGFGRVGYGPHRVGRMLATTKPSAGERIGEVAAAVRGGDPVGAYRLLGGRCRLEMLGPAFGTKFVYFAGDGGLILDRLIADALRRLAGVAIDPTRWDDRSYSTYLDLIGGWADGLGVAPDVVEQVLFTSESTTVGNQWADE